MSGPLRVVHYLNQFFGGIGGEEQADVGVSASARARWARAALLEKALGDDARIEATLDRRRQLRQRARADEAVARDRRRARPPPARRGGGRPGVRLRTLRPGVRARVQAWPAERGIAAITAMHPENPGASSARREPLHRPDRRVDDVHAGRARRRWPRWRGDSGRGEIARARRGGRLHAAGRAPRPRPRAPGLSARARHAARQAARPAVPVGGAVRRARARDAGGADRRPRRAPASPWSPPAGSCARATPTSQVSANAVRYHRHTVAELESLSPKEWEAYHAGYFNHIVNSNPNYILPLSFLRDLERQGKVGRVHEHIYALPGVSTPVAVVGRARAQHRRRPQGRRRRRAPCSSPPEEPAIVAAQRSPRRSSGSGIPVGMISAIYNFALTTGANRVIRGARIEHVCGDPTLEPREGLRLRHAHRDRGARGPRPSPVPGPTLVRSDCASPPAEAAGEAAHAS